VILGGTIHKARRSGRKARSLGQANLGVETDSA
jgi:hypothetical protein